MSYNLSSHFLKRQQLGLSSQGKRDLLASLLLSLLRKEQL